MRGELRWAVDLEIPLEGLDGGRSITWPPVCVICCEPAAGTNAFETEKWEYLGASGGKRFSNVHPLDLPIPYCQRHLDEVISWDTSETKKHIQKGGYRKAVGVDPQQGGSLYRLRFGNERYAGLFEEANRFWSTSRSTISMERMIRRGSKESRWSGTAPQPTAAAPVAPTSVHRYNLGHGPVEGIDGLEGFVMSSLTPLDQSYTMAQLEPAEVQRIKAVHAIGREGGPEAVRALTRLLEVDTLYLPAKDSRKTMHHAVIEELGRSGDEAAAEPVIAAFVEAAEQVTGTNAFLRSTGLSTKAAIAEDTVRTAAAALGSLGGARATAFLTEAAREYRYPRMIRRAASKALG